MIDPNKMPKSPPKESVEPVVIASAQRIVKKAFEESRDPGVRELEK